jgi:hypothetical protein
MFASRDFSSITPLSAAVVGSHRTPEDEVMVYRIPRDIKILDEGLSTLLSDYAADVHDALWNLRESLNDAITNLISDVASGHSVFIYATRTFSEVRALFDYGCAVLNDIPISDEKCKDILMWMHKAFARLNETFDLIRAASDDVERFKSRCELAATGAVNALTLIDRTEEERQRLLPALRNATEMIGAEVQVISENVYSGKTMVRDGLKQIDEALDALSIIGTHVCYDKKYDDSDCDDIADFVEACNEIRREAEEARFEAALERRRRTFDKDYDMEVRIKKRERSRCGCESDGKTTPKADEIAARRTRRAKARTLSILRHRSIDAKKAI